MELFYALWQFRIHFPVVLPVPPKALSEGGHALPAPVLAPESGYLDSMGDCLLQQAEGTLVTSLNPYD